MAPRPNGFIPFLYSQPEDPGLTHTDAFLHSSVLLEITFTLFITLTGFRDLETLQVKKQNQFCITVQLVSNKQKSHQNEQFIYLLVYYLCHLS